jgi:hypothetical protein
MIRKMALVREHFDKRRKLTTKPNPRRRKEKMKRKEGENKSCQLLSNIGHMVVENEKMVGVGE